jgi:hypothetical protein
MHLNCVATRTQAWVLSNLHAAITIEPDAFRNISTQSNGDTNSTNTGWNLVMPLITEATDLVAVKLGPRIII